MRTSQSVEKNVFVPFKKTELDLLREERQMLKQKEIAEKLEKKKTSKKSRRTKKSRKTKKRKSTKIVSCQPEVQKSLVQKQSNEISWVEDAKATMDFENIKGCGFHIPSF